MIEKFINKGVNKVNKKIKTARRVRFKLLLAVFALVFCSCRYVISSFEDIEAGARASSLAGAFVSRADDTSGIFYNPAGRFYLIDLARAFKPKVFMNRFKVKDLAQLYYSAPRKYFSYTDRLRFYLKYSRKKRLAKKDKLFIKKVLKKTKHMAKHNIKHDKSVPFME